MTTTDIKHILQYGLDSISSDEKIEVPLKDFILLYKTVEELRRFFHNPMHLADQKQVEKYIGNKEEGMYGLLNEIYSQKLHKLLTPELEALLESDQLDSGQYPFYYEK